MIIKCAPGCRVFGARPEIIFAIAQVAQVGPRHLIAWLTCITNGKHSDKSLHYVGLAFDLDAVPELELRMAESLAIEIREVLTEEFDVVVEKKKDGSFSHWHIEFQPKTVHSLR